jgi:hypothetical protein
MNKMGIIKQISAKGAQIGDKIKIIDKEIEYQG